MSLQHHEPKGARSFAELTPEEAAELRGLQRQIDALDSAIRSTPDSNDPNSPMRQMQKQRNEIQSKYDQLVQGRRAEQAAAAAGVVIEGSDAHTALMAERDQLAVAQNAPFTGETPIATGGEFDVEQAKAAQNTPPSVNSANAAGVVHQQGTTVETLDVK